MFNGRYEKKIKRMHKTYIIEKIKYKDIKKY